MRSGRAGKEDINAKCIFMGAQSKTVRGDKEGATVMVIKDDNENPQLPVLTHASVNSASSTSKDH